jgi:nucleoside-diphosphate-sugar epimerase
VTRFLVTGAGGFIGSAIVRRLAGEGHDAIALRADLLSADLPDLASTGATHVIHAAWYTNHADYLTHDANRDWVAASLRLARAFPGRFVGLGTCLEYDLSAGEPCAEDRTPLRPETIYARCKLELFEALEREGGDFAWARLFFVYGAGDRAGRLVSAMVERFSQGQATGPTYGGLRRDYIHVDDLAAQIVRIATSVVQGAINTGTGKAPTLSEIYAAGAAAFGRPDLAQPNDETGDQPPIIQADLGRFRRELGDPRARDIAAGLKALVA